MITHVQNSQQLAPSAFCKWWPHVVPATHLERRMGTVQVLLLRETSNPYIMAILRNWNIISFTGKECEQIEEAK